jgi:hypothetical protein
MSISFACECGKNFGVRDEFAGKRTKCPACGSALTVPTPATEPQTAPELSDEDKAFRALAEAPEPEPAAVQPRAPAYTASSFERSPPASPPPAPIPSARKPKLRKASPEEREARKYRQRQHDPDRARKILYMIGGVLMILGGGALGYFSIAEGISIRGGLFGFLMVFGGIGTFFRGVTGDFDDE